MQSVTITGNSLILFQTLKLLDFLQVMRNFNGEQDNKIKLFTASVSNTLNYLYNFCS